MYPFQSAGQTVWLEEKEAKLVVVVDELQHLTGSQKIDLGEALDCMRLLGSPITIRELHELLEKLREKGAVKWWMTGVDKK